MGHLITVATCNLNQWALDFEGNTKRIIESIHKAKDAGASLRVGPELEICGYGCLDHLLEQDLYLHSLQCLEIILRDESCYDILLDVGMPILHRNVRYNCRVICFNGKILLIRPKLYLAGDGNYREQRFFTPWLRPQYCEDYYLPRMLWKLQGSNKVRIGDAVISTPHNHMSLNGVEVITNSSGSHFTLRKLNTRMQLITEATRKNGGIYIYANQQGCDGDRLYCESGCAMIICNGKLLAQGSQFSLTDVEVVSATVDLEEVRAYRCAPSRGLQAVQAPVYERIETPFELSSEEGDLDMNLVPSIEIEPRYHSPEEEIALCTGSYLWDYLRRCGAAGYLVPLSGGTSWQTATIVFSMCRLVIEACKAGNEQVIADVKRLAKFGEGKVPDTAEELCNQLFHTVYMGMSKQSSKETRQRARDLAEAIGAYPQRNLIVNTLDFEPKFKVEGGTIAENLTLQNIQARSRMVTAYEFAQILPTTRKRPGGGSLLVLGSANVGESLRGYFTKYDCSSADINPIGSIDKSDLKRFIAWAEVNFGLPCLHDFLTAVPTAEKNSTPSMVTRTLDNQRLTLPSRYDELTTFGRLRKVDKLGPYGFQRLVHEWGPNRPRVGDDATPVYTPKQVAEKVKRFFHYYAINRHKMTTITPSLHCSPDDNRFDLRPFLYPPFFQSIGFKCIDQDLAKMESKQKGSTGEDSVD
ncbi:putative glutamine dependent NAD+ synthetase [Hypoxylon rubiginosum]|uniref:Glutamine dependent NAD+ synthetase n=1 Tax=Hypoxylon rubiginosum TaxID=110542 RepID=A0ACB9YIE3_9PEZI|nr:putative glutamine dependent NAD+ synthetase [Hypoxylon rubiginosum]